MLANTIQPGWLAGQPMAAQCNLENIKLKASMARRNQMPRNLLKWRRRPGWRRPIGSLAAVEMAHAPPPSENVGVARNERRRISYKSWRQKAREISHCRKAGENRLVSVALGWPAHSGGSQKQRPRNNGGEKRRGVAAWRKMAEVCQNGVANLSVCLSP